MLCARATMASEVKLFRPWAAYSYDLNHAEDQKEAEYQTVLLRKSCVKRVREHPEKKRTESADMKQTVASAFSALNKKQNTWCSRKRENSEKKLAPKPREDSNQEPRPPSLSSLNRADSTSSRESAPSETSRLCDSSFSDNIDPFHSDPQKSLDPLCIKNSLDLGLNYFNYPNYYDPSGLPYGLSPEEFFGCQSDLLYPNSTDPWADLAKFYSQTNQSKVKQRPKKFQCPHCNVAFSNNGQLKGHVRIHTGERPFKCDVDGCGKSFTRNEELTRHKRIHSGLRPFGCPHCGKKFGRKDHLKKHARTHLPQPRFAPQLVPLYPFLYGY